MDKYDYRQEMLNDINEYIRNEDRIWHLAIEGKLLADEIQNALYDELWIEDSVTGNGSGSYTFNSYKAEEMLCHNRDLLGEALEEFGYPKDHSKLNDSEWCDVTIRCYLLGEILGEWFRMNDDYVEEEIEKAENA